ncbi:MAG: Ig domain-containing protein, partial [Bacteroidota bacterium]|nr:Ig domain-containing protein [Bacteroidota bacterium]
MKFLILFGLSLMITGDLLSQTQACPINIDYSMSSLTHWAAYTGCFQNNTSTRTLFASTKYDSVTAPSTSGVSIIPEYLQASPNIGINVLTTATTDPFGGFLSIPNINSYQYNYAIKLGSTDVTSSNGGLVRGVSYLISVPAGSTSQPYTVTYAYAMVLENGSHSNNQQPLLQATITASGTVNSCASYSYYLPTITSGHTNTLDTAAALQEGFVLSSTPSPNSGQQTVWTRGWKEVTFDLGPYRGQTVTLTFEADNCVPHLHFAYAYIALRNVCAGLSISGVSTVCSNGIVNFSVPALASASYQWTVPAGWTIQPPSDTTNILSVKVGNTAGTVAVNEINSCANLTASFPVTLSPNANAGTVSGTSPLCIGDTATYTSTGDTGGAWSSSNTAVATVNSSTGLVTAVAAGTATITYTVSSGCNAPVTASKTVTVNPNANAGTISGTSPLCMGSTATYSSTGDAGGVWSSSNTAIATVNASTGLVTAVAAGTATITYTVSSGCHAPVTASKTITVNPNANAGTVSGTSPLCITATTTYSSNGDAGGVWSSSNTAVATVDPSSGLVTAVAAGTATITYTVSAGCNAPVAASKTITVNPNANAGTISGASPLCMSATTTYTSNGDAGGIWSSSNTAVATINSSTGLVTAVTAGISAITYTVTG